MKPPRETLTVRVYAPDRATLSKLADQHADAYYGNAPYRAVSLNVTPDSHTYIGVELYRADATYERVS